jgi:GNAT superfamily N-acetyltransferase
MGDVQVSDGNVRLAAGANTEPIRTATVADREAIRRLVNQAFVAERPLKKGGLDRLPLGDGELDRLLEHGTFLLLEEEGAIVACVYVEPRGERAYLGLLSITPERQRMGLGKKMNEAAEDFAREQGCRWMDLRVVSPRRDRLVPVYLRLGYAEQGTQEYPAEVAERMSVPGHFIVMSKAL